MKKLSVLLPAILCAALLAIGGWRLYGKFSATSNEIRTSHPQADSTAIVPQSMPADTLNENEE